MKIEGLARASWRSVAVAAVLFCVCAVSPAGAEDTATLSRVRVTDANPAALADRLEAAGFDVLEGAVTGQSVDVIVTREDWAALENLGLRPVLIERSRPLVELLEVLDDVPPGYFDLQEVLDTMQGAAAAYPGICQFVDLTTMYGVDPTWEGRHMYAVKISDNVTSEEDEPAFLMVGCHHAREIVTPVLCLYAMEKLTTLYGIDPQITALVDEYEIWIAPVWNPDGYNHVFTVENMWRKNRHVFAQGIGVDQNRNYPQGWYNACSGDTNPSSNIYKGPSPASEAETQTMVAWSMDQRFAKVLDYHSSGREVLHGYACWSHPFDAMMQQNAVDISFAAGYGGDVRGPSADGEHYQWQFGKRGAFAHLMETSTEFQPSYSSAQSEAVMVWPATLLMLERPISLWGYVTDAITGDPVEASISYPAHPFANEEEISSGGEWGRYHAYLPAGTYDVVFEADGYDLVTVSGVQITASGSTQIDVQLSGPPALLSPNGGENLPVNVATDVTWAGDPALSYHVQQTSNYGEIDVVSDGFESGSFDPAYATGGSSSWSVVGGGAHSGSYCAKAGVITHGQNTWLTRTVGGGDVSFWWRVSSEYNYDYFDFYIDGQPEIHESGESGWQFFSTTLPAGAHELKWEYSKDNWVTSGSDTAWIDDLEIMVDNTEWTDIIPLTAPGAMSTPWTPTVVSDDCKVRVRAWYAAGGYFGVFDESDDVFSVTGSGNPADINGDGVVDVLDLLALLSAWGPCPGCPEDVNGDGSVDVLDLLQVLANWT